MLKAENIMQVCAARTVTKGHSGNVEILFPENHAVSNVFKQAATGIEFLFEYGIVGKVADGTQHHVRLKTDRPGSEINGLIGEQTEGDSGYVPASIAREYIERILPRRTGYRGNGFFGPVTKGAIQSKFIRRIALVKDDVKEGGKGATRIG